MMNSTIKELRAKAKDLNIQGRWNMNKDQLLVAIERRKMGQRYGTGALARTRLNVIDRNIDIRPICSKRARKLKRRGEHVYYSVAVGRLVWERRVG